VWVPRDCNHSHCRSSLLQYNEISQGYLAYYFNYLSPWVYQATVKQLTFCQSLLGSVASFIHSLIHVLGVSSSFLPPWPPQRDLITLLSHCLYAVPELVTINGQFLTTRYMKALAESGTVTDLLKSLLENLGSSAGCWLRQCYQSSSRGNFVN